MTMIMNLWRFVVSLSYRKNYQVLPPFVFALCTDTRWFCDFKDNWCTKIPRTLQPLINWTNVIPCSTAECEREFSLMNIMMPSERSTLLLRSCFKENSSLHISIVKSAGLQFLNDLFYQNISIYPAKFSNDLFCHCTNSLSSLHILIHHCTFCALLHVKISPVVTYKCISVNIPSDIRMNSCSVETR